MCTTDAVSPVDLIQAGVAGLLDTDVIGSPDETVRGELVALLEVAQQVQAAIWDRLRSFDARGLAEADGLRTSRAWLAAMGRLSPCAASTQVKQARLLRQLPALAGATRTGAVGAEHVAKVAHLVEQIGIGAVTQVDQVLADLAAVGTPAQVLAACQRIHAHVDPDGPAPTRPSSGVD
jgi:hypothetical protein